jgi:hypothetical protein
MVDRILIIPDLHTPFHHPDAFHFLESMKETFLPQKVVCLGDEVDNHCLSFHDTDPDIPFSPSSELEKAIYYLSDLYKLFPKVEICESNHTSLFYRRQKHHGLPRTLFRDYREILEAPKGWVWKPEVLIDNHLFRHQFSKSIANAVKMTEYNVIQGHFHSDFTIHYMTYGATNRWGMTAGCLIDRNALAFSYGKMNLPQAALGCGLIVDGRPILWEMRVDKHGRWDGVV